MGCLPGFLRVFIGVGGVGASGIAVLKHVVAPLGVHMARLNKHISTQGIASDMGDKHTVTYLSAPHLGKVLALGQHTIEQYTSLGLSLGASQYYAVFILGAVKIAAEHSFKHSLVWVYTHGRNMLVGNGTTVKILQLFHNILLLVDPNG
jgi:hypothetical protein